MRKVLYFLIGALCACTIATAQTRTVTGKVLDEGGNPIANATIQSKGSRSGTSSGADGSFRLNVPADVNAVVISSINFTTQEIRLGRNTGSITTTLKAAVGGLSEVVVVGYGTQRRSEITAAITKVGGEKIADIPLSSVDQILQGKVAGLQSVTFSGQPGANQQIRIRGVGSFAASAQPLYVVDGIQINSGDLSRETTTTNVLSNINPDDIESVSVLKDAAATSIYGARGSNGVIVITTKSGKAGKTQFRASAEAGGNRHGDIPKIGMPLRSKDWLMLYKESLLNAGNTQAQADAAALTYGDGTVDTDWLNMITRTGVQEQYNVSASGGDAKTKFYTSGGYFKQQANVIGSDLQRMSGSIKLDHTVSKKISFSLNLQPTYTKQSTPISNSSAFSNPVMEFYFLRPTQNPYNADGSLNINRTAKDFSSTYNPLYILANDIHSLNSIQSIGKVEAKYNILDNLSFTSSLGTQLNYLEEYYYNNSKHGDGLAANGRGYAYNTRYFLYDVLNQLNYRANLTKNRELTLNTTIGYESITSKGYFVSAQSQNFPTPLLTDAVTASTPTIASNNGSDYSFAAAFGRTQLSYKGKYNLAGSVRRDGSSRFSQTNQYGVFPSVSASWAVNKEDFFESLTAVSDFKIRASYGVSGNAEIGNYAWRQLFGYGVNYNGQPGGAFNGIGNSNLQWEASKQTDIGFDLSLFKNRISITADYYKKVIDKLIFNAPTSLTIGFSTIAKNIGAMKNEGVEFTFNATPVKTKDFSWDMSFNISYNKNQITKIPDFQTQVISGSFILKPGYNRYAFYLPIWAGVNPANGDPLWYTDSSKKTTTNNYNLAKKAITGQTATPKFFGGFSNTFTYKWINLTADFYYNYGNYVQDGWASYFNDEVSPSYGKYTYNLNRWQKAGDITNVPKLVYNSSNSSSSASTRFLYKGDFIRLRNVQLGFAAPSAVAKALHINLMNLYVRGTNLWTKVYDKNIPFDPEQNINSQTNLNVFYNKAVTVGLNVGF